MTTTIDAFFNDISRFPVLTHEEHCELSEVIQKWQQHPTGAFAAPRETIARGIHSRDILLRHNLRLIVYVWRATYASRLPLKHPSVMDSFQAALEGLTRAAEKYLSSKGKFSTYASRWIHKGFKEFLSSDRLVRIPPNNVYVLKAAQLMQIDAQRNGERPPTNEEMVDELGKTRNNVPSPEHLGTLLRQAAITNTISMSEQDDDANQRTRRTESVSDRVSYLAAKQADTDLEDVMDVFPRLSEVEQLIIERRYLQSVPQPLGEIAEELNVNRATLNRYERQAITSLRTMLAA